jgi:hypothetical protein
MTETFGDADLFVSPPESSPDGEDHTGSEEDPFTSIVRARDAIRDRMAAGRFDGPLTVWLRGGRYPRVSQAQYRASAQGRPISDPNVTGRYPDAEPLYFGPEDAAPVTYAAYPGERPVIDGGQRIDGWETTTVNGVEAWRTTVDAVAEGEWRFRSLFVDGERRPRARWPTDGWFEVVDPDPVPKDHRRDLWNTVGERGRSFSVDAAGALDDGDGGPVREWHDPDTIEALIPHKWIQNRSPLAWTAPESDQVGLERYPLAVLDGGERVAFENVREALSEPGEWYCDRESGELLYIPLESEKPAETSVVAPRVDQLVTVDGEPQDPVEHLRFEGLTFRHADWSHPTRLDEETRVTVDRRHPDGTQMVGWGIEYEGAATSAQAQMAVPGAVDFRDARHCGLEECTIEHTGYYGVGFRAGCKGNRIEGCRLRDLGAGGIKFDGVNVTHPSDRYVENNHVSDCTIVRGGRVFPAAVGVCLRHARDTTVVHNDIQDMFYTGVSVGWTWEFGDCVERNNRIEANHISDIGQGVLSDLGGIYTIGVQPGTRIAGNLIHGIECYDYGGNGIYPDAGSSSLVIEDNVVFDADCGLHQHYGRENVVRNNVLVGGWEGGVSLSNPDTAGPYRPLTLEGNVIVSDWSVIAGGYAYDGEAEILRSDCNLLWNPEGPVRFTGHSEGASVPDLDFEAWQERGYDRNSRVADPEFQETASHQYRLPEDGPATALGIETPALENVGARPPSER